MIDVYTNERRCCKMKDTEGYCRCDTCQSILDGFDATITVTYQNGLNVTQKVHFCNSGCFLKWVLKTAKIEALQTGTK